MIYGDHNFIEITQQTKLQVALVVSSESSCAVRQCRHSQNAWARHVERVESCRVEPSGIWAILPSRVLIPCTTLYVCCVCKVLDCFLLSVVSSMRSFVSKLVSSKYVCIAHNHNISDVLGALCP